MATMVSGRDLNVAGPLLLLFVDAQSPGRRQGTPAEQTLPSHAMTRTAEENSDAGLTESLAKLKLEELTALSPEVIQRQATINIGRPSCIARHR